MQDCQMVRYGMQVGRKSQKCKWTEMQKLTEMRQAVSLCPYNHKQINYEAGEVKLQKPWKNLLLKYLKDLEICPHSHIFCEIYKSKIF